jgi:hypothetical protein
MNVNFIYPSRGAGDTTGNPLFNFGIEIQWRISLFEKGMKKSCKEFRIVFDEDLHPSKYNSYFPKGTELQFIQSLVKVVISYFLFLIIYNNCFSRPTVIEYLLKIPNSLKARKESRSWRIFILSLAKLGLICLLLLSMPVGSLLS